jgi:hypothetical protein
MYSVYNESDITYFALNYYLLKAFISVSVKVEFYNNTSSDIQNQCCVQVVAIISASTRHLYRRKLSQLLEGIHDHEHESLQEEELTYPVRRDGSIGENKPEHLRARSRISHIYPSDNSSGEALGKSSSLLSDTYYSSPREQRKDDLRSYSSLSSSYLSSSAAQPSTSSPRRMYGSAFPQVAEEYSGYYARQKAIFSGTVTY